MDIPGFITSIITSDAFASLLLTAVASAVTAAAGAAIYYVRKRILKDLDAAELEQLRIIAHEAVKYAEQAFKDRGGDVKLAAALEAADKMLTSYGIRVTTSMLRTVIEAAVYTALAQAAETPVGTSIVAPDATINVEAPVVEASPEEPALVADTAVAEPVLDERVPEPVAPQPGRALRLHGK